MPCKNNLKRTESDFQLEVLNTVNFQYSSILTKIKNKDYQKIQSAWNAFSNPDSYKNMPQFETDKNVTPHPLINDMIVSDTVYYDQRNEIYDKLTSQYLIGDVAIGIFIMESDGDNENWENGDINHPNRVEEVWTQIIIGLEWLYQQAAENNVNISFWFDNGGYYENVPTDDEPIETETKNDDYWIIDAMNYLGYGNGDHIERVYSYNNNLRRSLCTDWSLSIFVVDSWNDIDGMFADTKVDRFAYAKVWYHCLDIAGIPHYNRMHGGPYLVMTYDNDNYGIGYMKDVLCHEIGHIFGAPDEYQGAVTCKEESDHDWIPDCHSNYGYLFVPNYNCEKCNPNAVYCIMRNGFQHNGFCSYTKQHIGWRDSDGDGPADPIDPNNGGWMSVGGVVPGDLVKIYTLDGDFVNLISVTNDNMFVEDGFNLVIWNGHNYDNQVAAQNQIYLVTINDGEPFSRYLNEGQPTVDLPYFSDIAYSQGKLTWKLNKSFAYVRCFIYNDADELVSRLVWDKAVAARTVTTNDLGMLDPLENYRAEFYAWRPDGGASQIVNYNFHLNCVGRCGDVNADGVVDISDCTYLYSLIFEPGWPLPQPVFACGDADGSGQVDISDAVYINNMVFVPGSPPPGDCNPSAFPDAPCCPY